MSRRNRSKTLPLLPKWLPLIVERVHDVTMLAAESYKRQGFPESADRLNRYAKTLMESELWWVTEDMTTLAVDTAEDREGFDGRTGVPDQPATGFMVWENGLPIWVEDRRLPNPRGMRVTACSWRVVEEGIMFELYTNDSGLERFDGSVRTPLHRLDGMLTPGRRELLVRIIVATLALASRPAIGMVRDGSWEDGPERPKSVGRAIGRLSRPMVKFVYLHEGREQEDAGGSGSGREYECRWIVRGHYRMQPYGPNRSMRRKQWIPPHVAGPADKPLRLKPTVHIWRR